ncbi:putative porin [Methylophilus sp. 13]|uniref:putative porin n=1 Tax=Methylophilus sp. 13 TaxID=2781018 RepID=UPI00188F3A69|nr:putative porin [Methylophilus sp. 13]MBF5038662.1 putative porin [Methylophilus sp. 13]
MKIKAKNWMIPWLVAGLFSTQAQGVLAGERESLEEVRATTMNLIELLVQEGVLSKEKADALLKQAQAAKQKAQEEAASVAESAAPDAPAAATQSKAIRVQYVPEHVKNEMRAEIEQEVMKKLNYKAGERLGIPEWIDRVEWTGALRLRYQEDMFSDNNVTPADLASNNRQYMQVNNTSEDRQRQRIRALFGANLHINDWLNGGIRFTTGMLQTPVTPNQTEGFSQGKFIFGLDRAFLEAKPYDWLTLTGGRFANPFFTGNQTFNTDLLWDPDLAFDGLVARVNPKLNQHWQLFSTAGAFPIEEIESSDTNKARDKWLYAAQGGIEWTSDNNSKVKLGVAYYDFKNVEGKPREFVGDTRYDATVPLWRQKGNSTFKMNPFGNNCGSQNNPSLCGLASQFQLINFTGEVDLAVFDPVHVILHGAYVKNIGFDQEEILRRTNTLYDEQDEGYEFALMVGHPMIKKLHDWQVFGGYRRLEADAMLDGFTDSNFRLGGTDAKGFYLGAQYGLGKNAWLSSRYVSADEISGLPFSVDTFFLDFNGRF